MGRQNGPRAPSLEILQVLQTIGNSCPLKVLNVNADVLKLPRVDVTPLVQLSGGRPRKLEILPVVLSKSKRGSMGRNRDRCLYKTEAIPGQLRKLQVQQSRKS